MNKNWLTIEERKQHRATIKHLHDFNIKIENAMRKQQEIPLHVRKNVYEMTGCSDMGEALDALLDIKEYTQEQYLEVIGQMAPKSLSAFAEYINPDEPPAPHHEFLIDHLEAIESGDLLRMLLSMPPGHAKPLTLDQPVLMSDGTYKPLGAIEVGDYVVTHKRRSRRVTAVHDQGELPVVQINTHGRTIECAGDHPFLTTRGWREAQHLREVDALVSSTLDLTSSDAHDGYFAAAAAIMFGFRFIQGEYTPDYPCLYMEFSRNYAADAVMEILNNAGIKAIMACRHNHNSHFRTRVYIDSSAHRDLDILGLIEAIQTGVIPKWMLQGSFDQIVSAAETAWLVCTHDCDRFLANIDKQWHRILFEREEEANSFSNLMWRIETNASKPFVREKNLKPVKRRKKGEGFQRLAINDLLERFTWVVHISIHEFRKFVPDLTDARLDGMPGFYINPSQIMADKVTQVTHLDVTKPMRCLTVDEDHSFTVQGVVVHNSTYSSHLFPAWYLGRNPKKKFLQAGHTQTFCEDELGKKVRSIVRNERYANIFPDVKIAHDTSAAATWAIAGTAGKYMVRGVGQGISGIRGHIGGVDDPYASYKDAQSETMRNEVVSWYNADFSRRLLPNSPIYVVATRWHVDDLIGVLERLSKEGKIIPFTVINLPVFCLDEETDPLGRKLGEQLWDYYPKEQFLELKNTDPHVFRLLYECQPVSSSGNMLNPEWIRYYDKLPEGEPDYVTFSLDTANKATERSDYTALSIWYQYGDKHYLVEMVRKRLLYHEIKATIETYAYKYRPNVILIEDAGTGSQYKIECDETNYEPPAPVIAIKPHGSSKEFKFDAVLPIFETGKVYIPADAPWVTAYIKELTEFPEGSNDDMVDSTSQYLNFRRPKPRYGTTKLKGKGEKDRVREEIEAHERSERSKQGRLDMSGVEDAD